MKTQISRFSFDPKNRYSGVYQQQGRMITDADWNELQSIAKQRLDAALADVMGSGSPSLGGLSIVNYDHTLRIRPGRVFAGGVCGTFPGSAPVDYASQPDFPEAPGKFSRGDIVYADVWEREVTVLDEPKLSDLALGGADTCTRTQTMVQVKRAPTDSNPESSELNPRCGNAEATVILLQNDAAASGDFVFRLEIHDVQGQPNSPTAIEVKWSCENAAEAYALTRPGAPPPPEIPDAFKGDWTYEFFSRVTEHHLGVHLVPSTAEFPRRAQLCDGYPTTPPAYEFVRRWDGHCLLSQANGVWSCSTARQRGADLVPSVASDGTLTIDLPMLKCVLKLGAKVFVVGDYWLATARAQMPKLAAILDSAEPIGPVHNYVKLGTVKTESWFVWAEKVLPSLEELISFTGSSRIGSMAIDGTPMPVLIRESAVVSIGCPSAVI